MSAKVEGKSLATMPVEIHANVASSLQSTFCHCTYPVLFLVIHFLSFFCPLLCFGIWSLYGLPLVGLLGYGE